MKRRTAIATIGIFALVGAAVAVPSARAGDASTVGTEAKEKAGCQPDGGCCGACQAAAAAAGKGASTKAGKGADGAAQSADCPCRRKARRPAS